MKLVANIKLLPTKEQAALLRESLERCNQACNYLSAKGFKAGKTRQFDLHKLAYSETRTMFGIAAQVAVRCIAKVSDAYTTHKANGHPPRQLSFRKHSAQPYDDRIVSFKADDIVSIWTLDGRIKVKSAMGRHQQLLMEHRKGEVDLMYVRGEFYLACVCDIDDRSIAEPWADTTSPAGKLMLTVMAGVAEFERERIRERQREGIAAAKAKGIYKGGKTKHNPETIRAMVAAGKKKAAIARELGCSTMTVHRACNCE